MTAIQRVRKTLHINVFLMCVGPRVHWNSMGIAKEATVTFNNKLCYLMCGYNSVCRHCLFFIHLEDHFYTKEGMDPPGTVTYSLIPTLGRHRQANL